MLDNMFMKGKKENKPQDTKAGILVELGGFGLIIGFFLVYVLIPLLGVVFIVKLFDINLFNVDEIRAYVAVCKTKVELNTCDFPNYAQNISTYKVSYSSQRVISETGGIVTKYTDCSVKDRKNWSCSFDDKSGDFGFTSGTYFDIPNWDKIIIFRDLLEKEYYVSRLEFFNLRAKGYGSLYPIGYFLTVMSN